LDFDAGEYGIAETLSKAKVTSVAGLVEQVSVSKPWQSAAPLKH
jgi:hypothetical protein